MVLAVDIQPSKRKPSLQAVTNNLPLVPSEHSQGEESERKVNDVKKG